MSCLLVDMRSPGIEVRPLRQITGDAEFNEVFFEDVRVPRENLLGELHEGWQIAVSALQNERGILYVVGMQILLKEQRDRLIALARERGAGRDPILRQELARAYLGTEIFRFTCQRTLDKLLRFGDAGPRVGDHQAPLDRADAGDAAARDGDARPGGAALRHAGGAR